jgi:hypothetical protein
VSEHLGLLGFLLEANDIKEEMGVTVDEAFEIQRGRAAQRLEFAVATMEARKIPQHAKH